MAEHVGDHRSTTAPQRIERRGRVLFVDDEAALARALERALGLQGFELRSFVDPRVALEALEREPGAFDIAVLDVNMPGMTGLELLGRVREIAPLVPVVMLTADERAATATAALRAGAFNYTTKPISSMDEFGALLGSALAYGTLRRRASELERKVALTDRFEQLVGHTPSMRRMFAAIEKLAQTSVSVLILGESGTGKELVAHAIHGHSSRHKGPFVALNCGAIPESLIDSELFGHSRGAFTGAVTARPGVFVEAHGGTLFLDEIGEMPLGVQARLLRVLQEREVRPVGGQGVVEIDVRVIAATHVDLHEAVEDKRFRSDLYYRLNVVTLAVPSLRERIDDLPLLAAHFLRKHALDREPPRLTPQALEVLMGYSWPGNVRELENALLHALALVPDEEIDVDALPVRITDSGRRPVATDQRTLPDDLEWANDLSLAEAKKRASDDFERRYVLRVLERGKGNIAEAARLAGLDRSNFRRVLTRLSIDASSFKVGRDGEE